MKKIQVFFNYGIKNYVYQMIEWRYNIIFDRDRRSSTGFFFRKGFDQQGYERIGWREIPHLSARFCAFFFQFMKLTELFFHKKFSIIITKYILIYKAYALNEMANIERIRNTEQQITSTVDEMTNDFKERIQSILSDNKLLLSNTEKHFLSFNKRKISSYLAQVPHTLAPSTLFKDGQQMTSEAFFDEMNVCSYQSPREIKSAFSILSGSHFFLSLSLFISIIETLFY